MVRLARFKRRMSLMKSSKQEQLDRISLWSLSPLPCTGVNIQPLVRNINNSGKNNNISIFREVCGEASGMQIEPCSGINELKVSLVVSDRSTTSAWGSLITVAASGIMVQYTTRSKQYSCWHNRQHLDPVKIRGKDSAHLIPIKQNGHKSWQEMDTKSNPNNQGNRF